MAWIWQRVFSFSTGVDDGPVKYRKKLSRSQFSSSWQINPAVVVMESWAAHYLACQMLDLCQKVRRIAP
ncbi:hypothetical protein BMJ34_29645 [Sinorhizobium medicae]|nr:hypothetical protein BMJ34_29645 [Sinorhizobium medicae]PLU11724.1 hypothetical protein BMJ29_34150 [Sinorhizobium medicae]